MRPQDIVLGESYRFKAHPAMGYAKAIQILKPKQGINPHTYTVVKCEHSVSKNDCFGFNRYFKPSSLIRIKKEMQR